MQYYHATNVIIIYASALNELFRRMGGKIPQIILISNTGHCGGTLLGHAFESTGKCVTLCEPSVLDSIEPYWRNKKFSDKQYDDLIMSALKLLLKPIRSPEKVTVFVIKARPMSVLLAEVVYRLMESKCTLLFTYRNMVECVISSWKLNNVLPLNMLTCTFDSLIGFKLVNLLEFLSIEIKPELRHLYEINHPMGIFIKNWIFHMHQFRKLRNNNVPIAGVFYDELVRNPEYALGKIFDFCNLPATALKPALKVFVFDSQEKSQISIKALSAFPKEAFPDDLIVQCNKLCELLKLPLINEDYHVEGVITNKYN